MKKRIILTLLLIGLLAFGIGMGTFAWFTSSATSAGNVFETGILTIDSPGALTSNLSVDNIYPSWTSGAQTITVHNSGSLDFKYRVSVAPLEGNLLFDGPNPLNISINGQPFVGLNNLGFVELGTIASGQDGTFTVEFMLPSGADNSYQDISATFDFLFEATQIDNPGWEEIDN